MIEPMTVAAGDTWQWDREHADYLPSGGWSLTYVFTNAGQRFALNSTTNGNAHRITVAITDGDEKIPGVYEWVCFAKKTGERHQIASGRMTVTPNLEGDRPFDTRSDARKILASLMALQAQVANGSGLVQEYTISGRTMRFRTVDDLVKQLNYWRVQVANEDRAAKIAAGLDDGRRIGVRMQRV